MKLQVIIAFVLGIFTIVMAYPNPEALSVNGGGGGPWSGGRGPWSGGGGGGGGGWGGGGGGGGK
ncbi:PREDICTED: glycine-rich RNA-binding protein 1-like [Rhagoletis zephyria]|uniref:glycine-rich RNA-binding protein 1-like n=1 Tax=Rhagoletis zephyria TaxID=28612 RepID=UPI000811390B|nr:PREDICTED: glycine-rich RNA-binding protein 1-like [Rhagoletis zephyria]